MSRDVYGAFGSEDAQVAQVHCGRISALSLPFLDRRFTVAAGYPEACISRVDECVAVEEQRVLQPGFV